MSASETHVRIPGGCHCGGVTFEVETSPDLEAQECNCSICAKTGFLHLIVPASRFHLKKGKDKLTTYTFNTETAKHLFCKICGVKSFYVPRSNPDGYSVNVNCLEQSKIHSLTITQFDGQNWEQNAGDLAHLSTE